MLIDNNINLMINAMLTCQDVLQKLEENHITDDNGDDGNDDD